MLKFKFCGEGPYGAMKQIRNLDNLVNHIGLYSAFPAHQIVWGGLLLWLSDLLVTEMALLTID
ncbi:hypothetical protein HanHA89_Chr13g0532461 [Helianthus annuus]|nr:hypothetical protein HanHA89_Chr13g0532461 [Helianthus annuus]